MLAIAVDARPADCCLVPERREELTTEGGLDVVAQSGQIAAACAQLHDHDIRVSLFIDPETGQIDAAHAAGARLVELHTGAYADARDAEAERRELARLRAAAAHAAARGLTVHAGHGLNYHNVQAVAAIEEIVELNIGHAIVARAVLSGLEKAVGEMRRLMLEARRS
jgi:pyridoxine 5-phosphate synthase